VVDVAGAWSTSRRRSAWRRRRGRTGRGLAPSRTAQAARLTFACTSVMMTSQRLSSRAGRSRDIPTGPAVDAALGLGGYGRGRWRRHGGDVCRMVAALVGHETRVSGSEGPDVWMCGLCGVRMLADGRSNVAPTVLQGDGRYRRAVTSSWHVGLGAGQVCS